MYSSTHIAAAGITIVSKHFIKVMQSDAYGLKATSWSCADCGVSTSVYKLATWKKEADSTVESRFTTSKICPFQSRPQLLLRRLFFHFSMAWA